MVHSLSFLIELGNTFQWTDHNIFILDFYSQEWLDSLDEREDILFHSGHAFNPSLPFLLGPNLRFYLSLFLNQFIMLFLQVLWAYIVSIMCVKVEIIKQMKVIVIHRSVLNDIPVAVTDIHCPRMGKPTPAHVELQHTILFCLQQHFRILAFPKNRTYQSGRSNAMERSTKAVPVEYRQQLYFRIYITIYVIRM